MSEPHVPAESIFNAARERSPSERNAYLDGACHGDAALRARVEALLQAHDGLGSFLEPPTCESSSESEGGGVREGPGSKIGRYKLLQQIGEGGFGVVFMAEQEYPIRRTVALKVIKLGMDTKQVVARFEAERQALAMMDHPSIAKVLDGGTTETGRPYFVMDLVRGVPITEYCDAHQLPTEERLKLFEQVCQAVQHAHQKGVIHRDLKPTNVLVTTLDDKPVPKVIDFGIAKATQSRLTEKTLFTELRQMIGTPAYMSPEQAEVTAADVDTRSDIYSLGVLLYEMLTGTTPFDARELRSKAYGEVQRIIREVEPPSPSVRLSTLHAEVKKTVALRRQIEPGKLGQQMRGELDWIVMKALEKDRGRRYETASAMAADVRRHLADEPVHARPAGTAYRLRKWGRRHRAGAAAALAVAAALVLGLAGTGFGLLRARAERDHAVESEHAAQRQAQRTEAVSAFLQRLLAIFSPGSSGDVPARDMSAAADRLQRDGMLADDPKAEASIREAIGYFFQYNRLSADAVAQYRLALDARRRAGDDLGAAETLDLITGVLRLQGENAKAAETAAELLAVLRRRGIDLPDDEASAAGESAFITLAVHLARQREQVALRPDDATPQRERARTALTLGRLEEASEAFAAVARLDPHEHQSLFFSGALHLYLGDAPSYEHACRDLVDRFAASPDGPTLDLVSKACLLRPECPVDFKSVLAVLDRTETVVRAQGDPTNSWYNLARGMAEYRAGHYESATLWLAKDRRLLDEYARLTCDALTAMCDQRLGRTVESRAALRKVMADDEWRLPAAGRDLVGGWVENWVVLKVVLREANALIGDDRADDPMFYAYRGRMLAGEKRFEQALTEYRKAIELDCKEQRVWCHTASLQLYLGDVDGYRRTASRMLELFGNTQNVREGELAAKVCALAPGVDGADPARLAQIVDRAMDSPNYNMGIKQWFRLSRGIVEYRAGKYESALDWLAKSRGDLGAPTGTAAVDLYSAMCLQRLGHTAEAAAALAEGRRLVQQELGRPGKGVETSTLLHDWLICQIALREAEGLIAPAGTTASDRQTH